MRYFTLRTREELEALEAEHAGNPQELKRLLAEELTVRIHSEEDYRSVLRVSELLFGRHAGRDELLGLSDAELQTVASEIPSFSISRTALEAGVGIADLLAEHTAISSSKGEARRALQNNAISVNKEKISAPEHTVTASSLLHNRYLLLENGKKNKYILIAE
jgi:tyrosyl-tRNA synthetase